jgi:hypothetical protein
MVADRDVRVDAILRQADTHRALVRIFRKHFDPGELGEMFDQLPDGAGPMGILTHAVGAALAAEKTHDDEPDGDERGVPR